MKIILKMNITRSSQKTQVQYISGSKYIYHLYTFLKQCYIFSIYNICNKVEIILINFKVVTTLGSNSKLKLKLDKEGSSIVLVLV